MELEEALALIKTQASEIEGLKESNKTALGDLTTTHEKALQVSYNKGFDKAKNASATEMQDGYIKKEDVEAMLSEREKSANTELALTRLGVKNPKRAMKVIDDEDLALMGGNDFKEDDFKKKYSEDIVFSKASEKEKEEEFKQSPSNFTKNNKDKVNTGLTAEAYEAMSPSARAKIPVADKLALL